MNRPLYRGLLAVEKRVDAFRFALRRRLGRVGPVMIQPYRGFGTEQDLYLRGRVLKDKGIRRARDTDTVWQNLASMYRRFATNEVPGVRVRARFGEAVQEVVTDGEGYFDVHLQPAASLPPDAVWHEVALELVDEVARGQGHVRATGSVLVPPIESDFGIISDVDDTVIHTGATNRLRMLRTTMLHNARTRLPFEGVAAFYLALQRGPSGTAHNPSFYISSSPWNLYDFLADFLDVHGIPIGPLFLRDLGLDKHRFIASGHHEHKLEALERVLSTYPDLPFILIGDSGQEDPEIYQQAVRDFPGRIEAIYIRDVTTLARDAEVHAIAEQVRAEGVPMVLVQDTEGAALHAVAHGFIHPDTLPDIRAEKVKDEVGPG